MHLLVNMKSCMMNYVIPTNETGMEYLYKMLRPLSLSFQRTHVNKRKSRYLHVFFLQFCTSKRDLFTCKRDCLTT